MDNDAKENTGKSQTDNDGNVVNGIDQVLKYGYNLKGERTSLLRDNNVDGSYDYREVYTLDANGRQIQKEIDLTNDDIFDRKEVYTRDADGGMVEAQFYNVVADGSGTKDVLTKIEHYELNANNQRTFLYRDTDGRSATGENHPINGRNVQGIEHIEKYTLDAQGRIIEISTNMDADTQGGFERVEYRLLNPDGSIHKSYINTDNSNTTGITSDGKLGIDEVYTYEYDANRNRTRYEYDTTANGIGTDKFETYKRDVYGRATKTEIDNDGLASTPIDKVEYRYYDEQGRELRREDDIRSNGEGVDAIRYNEAFDENNRITKWWYDSDNDGVRGNKRDETRDDIQFDSNNRVIFENARWDWGASPAVTYGYDEYGRAIVFKVDYDRNGQINGNDSEVIEKTFGDKFIYTELTTLSLKGNGSYDMRYGYFNEKGQFRFELGDWRYDKAGGTHSIDRMFWGQATHNARDESFNFVTDFTKEELARFNNALDEIGLSGEYYSTKLTLDKATIAQIADTWHGLRIYGDQKDVVYLKNLTTDFNKQAETFNKNGVESAVYTTEVEGTTYTLYIDTEVSVLSV